MLSEYYKILVNLKGFTRHNFLQGSKYYLTKDTLLIERNIQAPALEVTIKQKIYKIIVTKAAWFSSEINIHCLTSIIILVSSGHLPVYALNTYLFSSQACEATFRSARSLNGTFSSITNFSVYEFMDKIEKISILNKINSTEESSVTTCSIKFPIHHKNRRDESSTATNTQNLTPITITDMEKIIIKTYQKAQIIMNELRLTETLKKNGLDDCKKLSSFVFKELNERSIVDYSFVDDDDIEESSDDEADDNNDNTSQSLDTDDESNENVLDNDDLDIHHIVTSKETFQGMKIYEQIDPSKKNHYFSIFINNKQKFIHKQTAARLLTKSENTLSSSRLSRVQQTHRQQ
ncbi:unnamed protein product [Rotaria magnacalcarata]|uniref:Uncharacterized protein n=2 Tax=Rotaria magnacalcarata TaxID=392030 RepID=A0A816ZTX3_9BILA|nr:unnamed protein product [Rotaria magnacalcarata]